MKILFVGPNASMYALEHRPGDPAAAKWAYGLLKGMSSEAEIHVLTHVRERCWPKGDVLWSHGKAELFPEEWPCTAVSYPALYKIRDWWLNRFYPIKAGRMLRQERFDAVVMYNCMDSYQVAITKRAHRLGIPSFAIVLDGDDPRRDNWRRILGDTAFVDGVAFLSYWAYENFPSQKPKLHLDGGALAWNGTPPMAGQQNDRPTFIHTGALDKWRGLEFMKGVVACLEAHRSNVRIVLCGKTNEEAAVAFRNSPNVVLRGFVSEAELADLSARADGFLNVREPSVGDNILNFPSKLPQYLSWGKPVVTTWIDSYAPDYQTMTCADFSNTPETFVGVLEKVAGWDFAQKQCHYEKVKSWFTQNKLWTVQARRMFSWMSEVLETKHLGGNRS